MDVDVEQNEFLTVDLTNGVGTITMNRPDQYNALNEQMASELRDVAVELDTNDDVRCVVLTGTGDMFCPGADLNELEGSENDGMVLGSLAARLNTVVTHMARSPKPTVTGVNGVAAGGGFGLALAGDIVLVEEDAKFDFSYPKLGLTGDAGTTFNLPKLVGGRRAREIVMLEEAIDPDEAVDMGLATEVVPGDEFEERLETVAEELARGPTRALGQTKRLLHESHHRSLQEHLDEEQQAITRIAGTEDYQRGYEAWMADEDPDFQGK